MNPFADRWQRQRQVINMIALCQRENLMCPRKHGDISFVYLAHHMCSTYQADLAAVMTIW